MKLSVKWQKLYKWYCRIFCLLTAILVLLIFISGTAWEVRNELIHAAALCLGVGLAICAIFPVNLLLWIISLIVWLCRRESVSGWHILGYGLMMGVARFVVFMAYAIVSGA